MELMPLALDQRVAPSSGARSGGAAHRKIRRGRRPPTAAACGQVVVMAVPPV